MMENYTKFSWKALQVLLAYTITLPCLLAQLPYCPIGTPGFSECEQVICQTCNLNGFTSSTLGYGSDPDNDLDPHFCSVSGSVQYVAFTAFTQVLSITVALKNCAQPTNLDVGLMFGCDNWPLVDCASGNSNSPVTITEYSLIVGHTYILIINAGAGSECDIMVSTAPANGTVNPNYVIPQGLSLSGDFAVCLNATDVYQVTPSNFVANYEWTAPNGTLINGQPSPVTVEGSAGGATVTVTWGATGGMLCVKPFNTCYEGAPVCHNVTVTPIPPTILPPVTICAEEAPYVLPWGDNVFSSGTFSTVIPSVQGCDSTLKQTVTVRQPNFHTLAPIGMCPGSCVTICGEDYCDFGNFTAHCQSALGCDSAVNFTIVDPNPVAEILGGGSITCTTTSVTLNSAPSPGVKTWLTPSGQTLGTGNSLVVNGPGTYILSVNVSLNGASCTRLDTVVVPLNNAPPGVTAAGAAVGCDTAAVLLHASSPVSPANYAWAGPNGFASTVQNPPVVVPGIYTVTITNPASGCTSIDTALVTICCHTFAGTLDTATVHICGEKTISVVYHDDEMLQPGDGLVFILYSDPANPAGSVLEYSGAPAFPYVPGLIQWSVPYFVAAAAGHLLAGDSLDLSDPCFSFSPGPELEWLPKPVISVQPVPPEMCKGDCVDVTFNFSGTPPFQFHYDILQNGKLVYSRDESSDALQKTVSICPSAFNPPGGAGALNFTVNYFRDLHCTCTD